MKNIVLLIALTIALNSCISELAPEPELDTDFDFYLKNPLQLDEAQQLKMNGIYSVKDDRDHRWSNTVICKWIRNRFCIYSRSDVVYAENFGGFFGDSLEFTGIMRVVRAGEGNRIKLIIKKNDGAFSIKKNLPSTDSLIIFGTDANGYLFKLEKIENLEEPNFLVIAHRGGCRNSERIGISENSLEMMEYAEILGADGIEIDVKRTKDDKLIIFHDDTFSPRTVQGAYLLGNVSNFTYSQISTFGRLVYGEKIPTLDEALMTIIDKTNLKLVWLDVKDDKFITTQAVLEAQIKWDAYAKSKGRAISILFGIPSDEIFNNFKKSELQGSSEVLCELSLEKIADLKRCVAWGPRWTNGITKDDVFDLNKRGIKVFRWTVDLESSIENCINTEEVNGILSNYPSLVAALKYSK